MIRNQIRSGPLDFDLGLKSCPIISVHAGQSGKQSVTLDTPSHHDHYTRFQRRQGAMNPEHKILLDELSERISDDLSRRFEEQDLKWDRRLSDQDTTWESKLDDYRTAQDAHVSVLEKTAADFQDWRLEVDGVVDDLKLAVKKLTHHYERIAFDQSASAPDIISPAPSASVRPSSGFKADWPDGHHVNTSNRGDLEALRQQFPGAPAWGQPGSFGGGGVSTPPDDHDQEMMDEAATTASGPRRGLRQRRPSTRVNGPLWARE